MSIGTFGSFTQARLAIYAAQTGITVTGNNISNINTEGYTRQRSDQASLYSCGSDRYYSRYDVRVGQGVLVKSLSQIRSPYLDIRFRTETAKVGYMDSMLEGLNEVATYLDEVGKGDEEAGEKGYGILGQGFNEIYDALEELVDQTGHQEYDSIVRSKCDSLAKKFNRYAADLQQVYDGTVTKLHEDVNEINEILTTIRDLNDEIRKCDIHGSTALELRDERNLQIDKLSELVGVEVVYSMEEISYGLEVEKLSIRLDNHNPDGSVDTDTTWLVDGIYAGQFILEQVPEERDPKELEALQKEDTGKTNEKIWPYIDKDHPGCFTDSPTAADGSDNAVNPDYEQYLKADGTPTADGSEARQVDSPNFNITVSELRNKAGRLLYNITKEPEVQMTTAAEIQEAKDALKSGGSVTTTDADGNITVTVYRQQGVTLIPEANPAYDSITNPNVPRYLDKDGNPTNNRDKANLIENKNVKFFKTVYTQEASKAVELDDNDLYGRIQAHRELLTEEGEFMAADVISNGTDTGPYRNLDEGAGKKRGIVYYQRALDLLANQFANAFNEANQGFRVDPSGNYITTGTNDKGETVGVPVVVTGTDATGAITSDTLTLTQTTTLKDQPAEIVRTLQDATGIVYDPAADNSKEIIDAYLMGQKYDANGNPTLEGDALKANAKGIFDGGVLFSNNGDSNDTDDITASNISVSYNWQNNNNYLVCSFECEPNKTEPASGANKNILHILYVGDAEKHDFVPTNLDATKDARDDIIFSGTFYDMWNNIGYVLSEDQKHTGTMLDASYETALEVDTQRDSVSAVDFNDEAMNLMMYAKSYNAACRLMTTLDSVIDKLVNNTGLTT